MNAEVCDLYISVNELITCTMNRTLKMTRAEALEHLYSEACGYPRALEGIFTVLGEQFTNTTSEASINIILHLLIKNELIVFSAVMDDCKRMKFSCNHP